MIIIATNKKNCIKEFEKELKRNPEQKTFTIYVDDGLQKSIIIDNDYIVKRTYFTDKNNALDTLIKAFEILPVELLYCMNDKKHGITIDTREEKKEMNNKDYYELQLSDITVTPDDMEDFSESVTKTYKNKIAEHYAMNPIIGVDYLNAVTSAAAYGFNYAIDLLTNRLFEKAKKPEKKENKLTKENKKKLIKMLEINPKMEIIRPTADEIKNEKITLTIDELADLLEELFSVG